MGENLVRNQRLVGTLNKLAAEKGISPAQLAIAWVLAKGKNVIPVMGARTRAQLDESLKALQVKLSPEDLATVEDAIPASQVAGTRSAGDVWKTRLHRGRASRKGEKRMRKSEMSGEKFHAKTRSLVVYSASRQRLLSDLPL